MAVATPLPKSLLPWTIQADWFAWLASPVAAQPHSRQAPFPHDAGRLRMPSVPEECPEGAKELMLQCLSVRPEERPSAKEAMQRLAALQRTPPTPCLHGPAGRG